MSSTIIILGGGPAGIEAALTASAYFRNVILVAERDVGDWKLAATSVWLREVSSLTPYLENCEITPAAINQTANEVQRTWADSTRHRLLKSGVRIIKGKALFHSHHSVIVEGRDGNADQELVADKIIIAVGSKPIFPDSMKPDGKQIFSYDTLTQLEKLPECILVVGDGPIGFEAVHLFSQLGVQVDWLVKKEGPKCFFDPDIDCFLSEKFRRIGVRIHCGELVSEIEKQADRVVAVRQDGARHEAKAAFVTLGFCSNVSYLQPEKAGLALNRFLSLDCDEYGRTEVESIYVAGDAQQSFAAVYSMAKARVAALHAVGQHPEPVDVSCLPLAFNDGPEAATVGLVDVQTQGIHSKVVNFGERNFKAYIQGACEGFLKILWNDEGVIVGGTAVGYQAKELITTLAMMVKFKHTIQDFRYFFASHPSIHELLIHTLHEASEEHVVQRQVLGS